MTYRGLFILVLNLAVSLCAAGQDKKAYSVTPAVLKAGDIVTVSIDPSSCAPLQPTGNIYAVMISYTEGKGRATDTLMLKQKSQRVAKFRIPESADALAFKFLQDGVQFSNNGKGIFYAVLDKKGKEQVSGLYSLQRLYAGNYNAGVTLPDQAKAMSYFKRWYSEADHSHFSYYDRTFLLLAMKDTAGLIRHLNQVSDATGLTEGQYGSLASFGAIAGKQTTDRIIEEQHRRFPNGFWTVKPWVDSARKAATGAEKLVWIKAFNLAYGKKDELAGIVLTDMYSNLLASTAKTLDPTMIQIASQYLDTVKGQEDRNLQNYNAILNQALAKDTFIKELLPLASRLMRSGMERLKDVKNPDENSSKKMNEQLRYRQFAGSASIYGDFLGRVGQRDSAAYFTRIAAAYYNWGITLYNDRYFKVAEQVVPADSLMTMLETTFRREAYTRQMKDQYLRLAAGLGISDASARLEKILGEKMERVKQNVRNKMLDKQAPDFRLPGLNGGESQLSALKGKVVVLDFWATWCTPCIASFPSMQILVDRYKDNKDVAFLFVDTFQKEENKYDLVKKFMRESGYRFDVYMDEQSKIADAYGVTGIPSKIVIDKKGILRFFSLGFDSDEEKGLTELQAMIEVAAGM